METRFPSGVAIDFTGLVIPDSAPEDLGCSQRGGIFADEGTALHTASFLPMDRAAVIDFGRRCANGSRSSQGCEETAFGFGALVCRARTDLGFITTGIGSE